MSTEKVLLGVNIDHVATLRQARGTYYPEPIEAASICMNAGAVGITLHLREDRRHIQDADVHAVRALVNTPLNLEMAVADEIVDIAMNVKPAEVCLVPEKRQELTTEGGLDVVGNIERMREVVGRLQTAGIKVSMFIDPDAEQIEASHQIGAEMIELHTGAFCDAAESQREEELKQLIEGARLAHRLGLQVNAGHGINLETIDGILRIPYMHTLNIGHSIIARAVFVGLERAVREMMAAMDHYAGGEK